MSTIFLFLGGREEEVERVNGEEEERSGKDTNTGSIASRRNPEGVGPFPTC